MQDCKSLPAPALLLCTSEDFALLMGLMFFLNFVLSSDEREAVQKKTFTKWVNSILSRVGCRISDLYLDLRDGRMLIKLLEVLSGERLVRNISVSVYIPLYILCITQNSLVVIHFSLKCSPKIVFFVLVFKAQTNKRQDAYPLFGKCGQGSSVPQRAKGPPGEHGFP